MTVKIDFNVFDRFRELYAKDPEEADRLKAELIERSIQNALSGSCPPPERDLRAVQWRIQVARETSKNPNQSMVRAYQMMWNGFVGEGGLKEAIKILAGTPSLVIAEKVLEEREKSQEPPKKPNNVIALRRKN